MGFLSNLFGASKDAVSESAINKLASAAPDLMSAAGIREAEENLDRATKSFVEAKNDWQKEKTEAEQARTLYNQRVAAAENIMAQMAEASGDAAANLEASLNTLLATIESHAVEVDREEQEAADASLWMAEAEQLMTELSTDLKNARKDLDAAKRDQATAIKQKERAERMESRAKEMAGIRKGGSSLNTAAAAMRKNAENTRSEADAAKLKADMLRPSNEEETDDNIAKAMAAANGTPASTMSAAERLAALKK